MTKSGGVARSPIADFGRYKEELHHIWEETADGLCSPLLLNTPEMFARMAERMGYSLNEFSTGEE